MTDEEKWRIWSMFIEKENELARRQGGIYLKPAIKRISIQLRRGDKVQTPDGCGVVDVVEKDLICVELDADKGILHEYDLKQVTPFFRRDNDGAVKLASGR